MGHLQFGLMVAHVGQKYKKYYNGVLLLNIAFAPWIVVVGS